MIDKGTVSLRQKISLAFGIALEADLPEVLVRSTANPSSLLTLVLGTILTDLLIGFRVGGIHAPCDHGFPRRPRRRAMLTELFC